MTQHRHVDLPPDEQADIESACARHGFVPEDFEFEIVESGPPSGQESMVRKAISVERVVGGQFQTYEAGNGKSWTAAFESDLAADWFGAPLAD